MKKMMILLLAMMLIVAALTAAFAEEEAMMEFGVDPLAAQVQGWVTGWTEEGSILVQGADGGRYQVNMDVTTLDAETVLSLQLGDYITVHYDGMLSRSVPAQLFAGMIECFKRTGEVTSVDEDGRGFTMLAGDEELYVHLNDLAGEVLLSEGQSVTVYFDGRMTRSIPAQINALFVRTIHLSGMIGSVERDETGAVVAFAMTDEALGEVIVFVDENTRLFMDLAEGEMACVAASGAMTMSLPAQTYALEVLPMAVPAM